jgi:hypothetical protein
VANKPEARGHTGTGDTPSDRARNRARNSMADKPEARGHNQTAQPPLAKRGRGRPRKGTSVPPVGPVQIEPNPGGQQESIQPAKRVRFDLGASGSGINEARGTDSEGLSQGAGGNESSGQQEREIGRRFSLSVTILQI